MTFPLVITATGPQPTPPAAIQAALIALVASSVPGYTATLPFSMIEDISSTEVAGLAEIDSARVEVINSLTTMGANAFLLLALGQLFIGPGSAPASPTNTSVFVQFVVVDSNDAPVPGYVIGVGFTVSDGTYQYVVQDGGVTDSSGTTPALFCVASIPGSWAIATNAVSQIVSAVPTGFVISCFNPAPGIPGNAEAETEEQYRARVNQALQSVSTGTTAYLKTLLNQVTGVQARLISTRPQPGGGWEIIVGGGDPYQVAGAIFASGLDISTLVGSTLNITNISSATTGVVTIDKNHGYTTGQTVKMTGIVGPTALNGNPYVVTVLTEKSFSIPVNTTLLPAYVSGGVCSPNSRNETPNIIDPPDEYAIPFVVPPQQTVTIAVSWNTTQANFVSQASVAQLAAPALIAYVNSILVGAPMSLLELSATFVEAVASILDPTTISVLSFSVSINGVGTVPAPGSQLIFGDPESFFFAAPGSVTVTQA